MIDMRDNGDVPYIITVAHSIIISPVLSHLLYLYSVCLPFLYYSPSAAHPRRAIRRARFCSKNSTEGQKAVLIYNDVSDEAACFSPAGPAPGFIPAGKAETGSSFL
jgi:hypothetical protein